MASNLRHYPGIILTHSISKRGFQSTLFDLCEKDSPRKGYFKGTLIPALDMDAYETDRPGKNEKTADAVIGICNRSNQKYYGHRLLIVELRTNYESTRTLKFSKVLGKEKHTRDLLRDSGDGCRVDGMYCLIFKPTVEEEGKYWVNAKQKEHSGIEQWSAFSPDSFCNFINYAIVEPFEPLAETEAVLARFAEAVKSKDINKIDSALKVVSAHLDNCTNRYLLGDCEYLAEEVKKQAEPLSKEVPTDEDEALELEVLLEDITTTIKRYLPKS